MPTNNEEKTFALVPAPPHALDKAASGARRILVSMVSETLALAKREASAPAGQLAVVEDAEALFQRGVILYYGEGVPQDYALAANCFRKASEENHAVAQYMLSLCHIYGRGVAQDYAEAVKWYRKAAEQGFADAQYALGFCYANAQGVAQDQAEAVKWYRKAAAQGFVPAQEKIKPVDVAHGDGLNRCHQQRQDAQRELAMELGLPLGRAVEVWLKDGIELHGVLRLKETLLFLDNVKEADIEFRVGSTNFNYADIQSCVRTD